jgi:cytochrome c553
MHRLPRVPAALVLGVFLIAPFAGGCRPSGAQLPLPAEQLFTACVNCHGEHGEGVKLYAAPAIAGLPDWYLEATLHKFRQGGRGLHADDVEGLRMKALARALRNDAEVKSISAYISKLPPPTPPATIQGDAEAGKASFGTCVACHGPTGAGNPALKAPPINSQHDWYLASQLRKFKAGIRGTNPLDVTGAQMRPMAMTLPDDNAVHNVVAYIRTLNAAQPAQ